MNKPILLPCPYCGAPATTKIGNTVFVQCTQCTAVVLQRLRDPESALRMWNTRTENKETPDNE